MVSFPSSSLLKTQEESPMLADGDTARLIAGVVVVLVHNATAPLAAVVASLELTALDDEVVINCPLKNRNENRRLPGY